jgi:hypothetical protein
MDKNRILAHKINNLLSMFPAVAMIGPRQCGKSTLAKQLRPEWRYYDLENPNDYELISTDPVAFFEINHAHIVIDEAQQFPDLFKVIRGVIDSDRNRKGRFLLTGSSSPSIVRGITESLAGRIATTELWPFKQCELYDEKIPGFYHLIADPHHQISDLRSLQNPLSLPQSMQSWFGGGFPDPVIEGRGNPDYYVHWHENFIADYINRDIRALFPRLNIQNYRHFLTLLSQFSGHQLNMSDMARSLGISVSTIKDYLDIVHQTFLWRNLESYTKNRLKKVQKANKGFFRDSGLLHYLLKISDLDSLLLHPVAGFSFECFVIEEIIRGLQSTMVTQLEFSYYRTIDRSEVDLIIEGPFGIIPVEIKLASSVTRQSLKGLENFISDTRCNYGIIVNRAKRIEMITDQIIQIPVQFL